MKLAKKTKRRTRRPLSAWVEWPCGDITKHEILSEATCPHTLYKEYELANSFGPIWKRWYEIDTVTYSSYGGGGWKAAPEWTSSESEC